MWMVGGGAGVKSPRIINFGARHRRVVSYTLQGAGLDGVAERNIPPVFNLYTSWRWASRSARFNPEISLSANWIRGYVGPRSRPCTFQLYSPWQVTLLTPFINVAPATKSWRYNHYIWFWRKIVVSLGVKHADHDCDLTFMLSVLHRANNE
jgi:hypothetical protein